MVWQRVYSIGESSMLYVVYLKDTCTDSMSQKIHPFHLRSQRADPEGSSLQGTIGTHGTAGSL